MVPEAPWAGLTIPRPACSHDPRPFASRQPANRCPTAPYSQSIPNPTEAHMKAIRRVVFIVAGLILIAAPVPAQEIVIAIGSEPSTLDPQTRDDGGERAVNDNVYETLMARTPTASSLPGLAAGRPKLVDADLGVQAAPGHQVPQRRAVQRRRGRAQRDAPHRPGAQVRADGLFRHHQGRREGGRPHGPDHHHGPDPILPDACTG